MSAPFLSPKQLSQFKSLFEQQKNQFLSSYTSTNEQFCVQLDDLFDLNDLTSREQETSMQMRLRSRETIYIKKIEEALKRITQGSFGECVDCGQEIGFKRLQARPTTTSCVTCKEERENREQHHSEEFKSRNQGMRLRLA